MARKQHRVGRRHDIDERGAPIADGAVQAGGHRIEWADAAQDDERGSEPGAFRS